MNLEKIPNFFKDKKENFQARMELSRLTHGEVDEISIRVRRPDESVFENERLIVSGYHPGEDVFAEIRIIKGPAVLDICVSDRNIGDNFVTIKKK